MSLPCLVFVIPWAKGFLNSFYVCPLCSSTLFILISSTVLFQSPCFLTIHFKLSSLITCRLLFYFTFSLIFYLSHFHLFPWTLPFSSPFPISFNETFSSAFPWHRLVRRNNYKRLVLKTDSFNDQSINTIFPSLFSLPSFSLSIKEG